MKSTAEVIERLEEILNEKEPRRSELIADFQRKIFKEDCEIEKTIDEVLNELAYDMDFYEPNEEWRKQSESFYGSERLEEEVKEGLIQLQNITSKNIKADANE